MIYINCYAISRDIIWCKCENYNVVKLKLMGDSRDYATAIIRVAVLLYKVGSTGADYVEKIKCQVPVQKKIMKVTNLRNIVR